MKDCAKVLWNRGLLRKGYGICHGVAGNAYGFLTAYQLTGDQKYIHQAIKVATFSSAAIYVIACVDYSSVVRLFSECLYCDFFQSLWVE